MGLDNPMKLFLEPRSVAVIGASRKTGKGSFNIFENLLRTGYRGQVYPVNPGIDSILGRKVYQSVEQLPPGIDLGVVIVPRDIVPRVVDSSETGIRAFIVVTEGFAEADERGKVLQSELVAVSRSKGVRILGPNSLGVINSFHNFSSSFAVPQLTKYPVAFVCQSGGFLHGFSGFAPGKSIDVGNMCDIDFAEVLEYLENDPETKVIALHIEGLKDGRRFMQTAARVRRKKPVLVLKTGRSAAGARSAASHTGSLAGRDGIYRAAFKQAGLIQADNVDEMGDFTKAFVHLPPLKGNKLAILTPSGATATAALDAMEPHGFDLARLSETTVGEIKHFFPPWSLPLNPVDIMAASLRYGYKAVFQASLEALLNDDNVNAVMCIAGNHSLGTIQRIIGVRSKPVVVWVFGEWEESLYSSLKEAGYPAVYPSPERAVAALAARYRYSQEPG